jgi:hypothetical protein
MIFTIFLVTQVNKYSATDDEWQLLQEFEANVAKQDIESEALLYIAGYVAHRFLHKYPHLGCKTSMMPLTDDWLSFISRGNCIRPEFFSATQVMNIEFEKYHGQFFNLEDKIFDKLTSIVCTKIKNEFPTKVVACLVRTRTYIRLRKQNREITIKNSIK